MLKIFHYINKLSLGLFIILLPSISFAGLSISPIKIALTTKSGPKGRIESVTLENKDGQDTKFQVSVYKKQMVNGKEQYVRTDEIMAAPIIFFLPKDKSQLVRVALNNSQSYSENDEYRVSIVELPHGPNPKNAVRFMRAMHLPVSVNKTMKEAADSTRKMDDSMMSATTNDSSAN